MQNLAANPAQKTNARTSEPALRRLSRGVARGVESAEFKGRERILKPMRKLAFALALLASAGCGSPAPFLGDDAGTPDAGIQDAGIADAGSNDAGSNDAGSNDAGSNDAGSNDAGSNDAGSNDAGSNDAGSNDAGNSDAGVTVVGTTAVQLATAPSSDEFVLAFHAVSASHTSWAQAGNEALILNVNGPHGLITNLVMHQGADGLTYQMQLGALRAGDAISVSVSASLSATAATRQATLSAVTLTAVTALGSSAEGILNAPIIKWPVKKRFDDFPVMLGWSKARRHYELYYTDENGGTAALCGGGAIGMQSEIGRWGRGSDDEGIFSYGTNPKTWERCNNTSEPYSSITPSLEALHPILYYGDGHNRLFESRGGYGQTCGTSSDKEADGALDGWNTNNPGNDAAHDAPYVVTVRLVPIDLDALNYAASSGRREAALDKDAPWLYRLTDSELSREGKIDQSHTFNVEDYLFIDLQANDVNGSGDNFCSAPAQGGFKLRAHTSSDNVTHDSMQMTASYFTSAPATGWKRMAIALGSEYTPAQINTLTFDAYDSDGIFLLSEGDAFMVRPAGDNGASILYVHQGTRALSVYVDDNNSGCTNGVNTSGPTSGASYACEGGSYTFAP
jgi:hypothetical protein